VLKRIGRNDSCPCGSGKKFKKCCLGKSVSELPDSFKARIVDDNPLNDPEYLKLVDELESSGYE